MSRITRLAAGIAVALVSTPILGLLQSADMIAPDWIAERRIVTTFTAPGNADAAHPDFDFPSYVNHECFVVTGSAEQERCSRLFGRYANLKWTMDTGLLSGMLLRHGIAMPAAQVENVANRAAQEIRQHEEARIAKEEPIQRRQMERGTTVWRACKARYGAGKEAASCYQRNVRVVLRRLEIPVEDIVRIRR